MSNFFLSNDLEDFLENIQSDELKKRLKNIFEYKSKNEQFKVIDILINKKYNVILIAKTKYDKSMIFQIVSTFKKNVITILIYLLNALKDNQIKTIKKLFDARSIVLNSKMLKKDLYIITRIEEEHYTHILIESKMILESKKLRFAIQSSLVQSRITLMIIDETHLVKQ